MNIKKIVYVESVKNMFLKVWIMWNVKQFYWSRFSYVSIPAEWNWKLPYSFLVAFWVLGDWGSVFPTPVRFCSSSQNWFSGTYLSGLMCGIQEYGLFQWSITLLFLGFMLGSFILFVKWGYIKLWLNIHLNSKIVLFFCTEKPYKVI